MNFGDSADEIAEEVVARLSEREMAKAAEAGLERQSVLELARRLKPGEDIDFDQAIVRDALPLALRALKTNYKSVTP